MQVTLKTFPITKSTPGAPEKAKKDGWYGASYRSEECLIIKYDRTEKEVMRSLLLEVAEIFGH